MASKAAKRTWRVLQGWQDIGVMLEKVIANYSVGMIMHGEVIGSMVDQIF